MKTDKELLKIFATAFYHMADDDPVFVQDRMANNGKDLDELYVIAANIMEAKEVDCGSNATIEAIEAWNSPTYTLTLKSGESHYKIQLQGDSELVDHIVKLLNENPL